MVSFWLHFDNFIAFIVWFMQFQKFVPNYPSIFFAILKHMWKGIAKSYSLMLFTGKYWCCSREKDEKLLTLSFKSVTKSLEQLYSISLQYYISFRRIVTRCPELPTCPELPRLTVPDVYLGAQKQIETETRRHNVLVSLQSQFHLTSLLSDVNNSNWMQDEGDGWRDG